MNLRHILFLAVAAVAIPQNQQPGPSITTIVEPAPSVLQSPVPLIAPAPVPVPVQAPVSSSAAASAPGPSSSASAAPGTEVGDYPVWQSSSGTCNCGYTYCPSVLATQNFTSADYYMATCLGMGQSPEICQSGTFVSPSDPSQALFLCRGADPSQLLSSTIQLICGCQECFNIGPDHRAHCSTYCLAATSTG